MRRTTAHFDCTSFAALYACDMADEVKTAITENASGPSSASGDSGSVSQHRLTEQIAADKYLRETETSEKPHRGMRLVKLVPPGAI